MKGNSRFWTGFIIFQVAFGLTVFAITRHVYMDSTSATGNLSQTNMQRPIDWTDAALELDSKIREPLDTEAFPGTDPFELSRKADEYFADQQYARAAELYEQLLAFAADNADVHNNLGLTLHYIGRSVEALARLDEGATIDPANQRIWLTIGFVNADMGRTEDARMALMTAIEMDADSDIGRSARKILDGLPAGSTASP